MVQKTRLIEVKIPAGIASGSQLRLAGEGESGGPQGVNGDLYVIIHTRPHKKFTREGNDLHMAKTISFPDAVLGTNIQLDTFGGLETVKIPEGTQNNEVIQVRNKGMPYVRGHGYGDLYVHIIVDVPKKLNRKARKLIEELKDELD